MALSMSTYSGAAAEHNYSPVAERPPPAPLPVAEPAPQAKVAMVVLIRTRPVQPEAKRAAEPRQWTGLSAQLASDYQHDDEHAPNSPMRQCAPSAPATVIALEPAAPRQLLPSQPKPKPKSPGLRPAASPFGPNPNQQWAGLSAAMADEFPHAAEADGDEESPQGRQRRSTQLGFSPSSVVPTAPPVSAIGAEVRGGAMPASPGMSPSRAARAGPAAAEPLSPSFRPTPAGVEPLQWLGLSQDSSSALHNMSPSPENSRQRQRRLSREVVREIAAVKLAEVAEDFQHARPQPARAADENPWGGRTWLGPAETAAQAGGISSFFDYSPISMMSAN